MKEGIALLIVIAITFLFNTLVLINAVRAHQAAQIWFHVGAGILLVIAGIVNYSKLVA